MLCCHVCIELIPLYHHPTAHLILTIRRPAIGNESAYVRICNENIPLIELLYTDNFEHIEYPLCGRVPSLSFDESNDESSSLLEPKVD